MKNYSHILICLALAILMNPIISNAQREILPKWEARIGVGLLPTFLGQQVNSEMQPMSLEVRFKPTKKYSVGLLVGQSVSSAMFTHHTGGDQYYTNRYTLAAVRGAVHYTNFEKWDIYGGLVLGYSNSNVTYKEEVDKSLDPTMPVPKVRNGLMFSGFMGMSYEVKKNFHLFGELGCGLSLLTAGISVEF